MAALVYGELASLMPHAGGQYVFLKEAYNPLVGFLYGWSAFLVIQGGTIAAVAMGFAKFTGVLFPWVAETHIWFSWHFLKVLHCSPGCDRINPAAHLHKHTRYPFRKNHTEYIHIHEGLYPVVVYCYRSVYCPEYGSTGNEPAVFLVRCQRRKRHT